ncbi:hypothetical protein D9M69_679450 [compost metagenome]
MTFSRSLADAADSRASARATAALSRVSSVRWNFSNARCATVGSSVKTSPTLTSSFSFLKWFCPTTTVRPASLSSLRSRPRSASRIWIQPSSMARTTPP